MDRARIRRIQDIEHLRQIALALETETRVLYERVSKLRAELAVARNDDKAQIALELKIIQEQLARRDAELFGSKSERRGKTGEDGAEDGAEGKKKKKEKKKQKGHGPTAQPKLPRVPVLHTLDEADQVCPHCGGTLRPKPGQMETSEEIHCVERIYCIREHQRQKYGCSGCGHIETALPPEKLLEGGRYSVEFAVQVAIDKFADHLPLERQVDRMARSELHLTSQALWDQTQALADLYWPTYQALQDDILTKSCIGVDETWWRVMGKGGSKKWWAWTLVSDDAVFHGILPGRSNDAAKVVLKNYSGIIVCDGYPVYTSLERAASKSGVQQPLLPGEDPPPPLPDYLLASCWAHVRRGFFKLQKHYPEVSEVLDLMGELYAIEARAREAPPDQRDARRAELRAEESKPVTDRILTWLRAQKPIPGTGLDDAVRYALNRWASLLVFLTHPQVPLDNNHSEQALRDLVLGRNNHQGSRSEKGTRVAALLYSLIESAERCGVNPARYLRVLARAALRDPGVVILPRDLPPDDDQDAAATA